MANEVMSAAEAVAELEKMSAAMHALARATGAVSTLSNALAVFPHDAFARATEVLSTLATAETRLADTRGRIAQLQKTVQDYDARVFEAWKRWTEYLQALADHQGALGPEQQAALDLARTKLARLSP